MRILLAALGFLVTLAACQRRTAKAPETGSRMSADTMVTQRQMRDTSIIRHDTTVGTDTIHKRGTKPTKTDTIHKP